MRAGVGPHGPTHRARDGQAELQPRQPGLLRLGRRSRHRDAGLGRVAVAVDARPFGTVLDDQPAHAGVADDDVAAPTQDEVGQAARPREAHEGAQLEGVVDGREEVGRPADAHRGEPRQRFVA